MSIRDAILLLDLVVTLAKFLLVLVFPFEDALIKPIFFTTALIESFSLMIIHDIFSLSIWTYL